MYCSFYRKSDGHTIKNCPRTAPGLCNRRNMYCTFCHGRDHTIEACPKTYPGFTARKWHPESVADHFIQD